MSKSLKRVTQALVDAGVDPDITELSAGTRTAQAAADAVGCGVDQIAKSIIFQNGDTAVLFITAGGNRVDIAKATQVAGMTLDRADPAFVRAHTGFAIGGVSPIGHLNPPRVFFDPKLLEFTEIWAAAGTPHHVFAISPGELAKISNAQTIEFTE